ncbi:MAG: BatD family protein [Flavobacteriales bacterium]|nr:BatD family protein [Flavobacteriales bacterium]MCW8914105.1 BatD family protein [Flavobacteriales bacterium]MCW8938163.1 BatD family protein [Flavobacteriales bacterium]MCW8939617.1 BatD family protein [Flavobacteriales bacterium]MCW8968329.1 BatD family protein [Flavobacteriales bacterium]
MRKLIYIFVALLLPSFALFSQNLAVKAVLDTNFLMIGEQTQLHFIATYQDKNTQILFPQLNDTIIKEIEVLSKSPIDTSVADANGLFAQAQSLLITSFDSGYYVIPPFQFIVNGDTIESDPLLLEVQSMEVDTANAIFDIKQPLSEPFSIKDWLKDNWVWLAAILAALIGIFFLVRYLRREKPVVEEKIIPKIPVHEIALEKLRQLNEQQLWQNGRIKAYHSEISEILREYIEERYQVNALEETTSEIMHGLRLHQIPEELKLKLSQTLTLADLVKFAKEQPLANENENSLTNAIEFVEATKMIEPENTNPHA